MRALALLIALSPVAAQSSSAELDMPNGLGASAPAADAAARRGLEWLASTQTAHGAWIGHVGHKRESSYLVLSSAQDQEQRGEGHLGVTSLAGLAFLAGGHLPGRGQYGQQVQRCLDYVIDTREDNGYLTDSGSRMYSHAFATLFLAQVHGMVRDRRAKDALEDAVHWIVDCQNRQGGWRYNPFTTQADLSVTVCQLQALRSARNIGIEVPKATIDRAVEYVLRARTPRGRNTGLFFYKTAGRGALRKNQQFAINAAAVTSLFSAGEYDREVVGPALGFLESEYDRVAYYYRRHYFYWYGNYYACQAFFQDGGERFRSYYKKLCRDLVADQQDDGRWINEVGPGDAFSTAVACLLLQVRHQYLPIFQR
ncbi:MAG: prenyltransferase/squalene oxidase repeat-containing protein [Planctomycetota bacterium]